MWEVQDTTSDNTNDDTSLLLTRGSLSWIRVEAHRVGGHTPRLAGVYPEGAQRTEGLAQGRLPTYAVEFPV